MTQSNFVSSPVISHPPYPFPYMLPRFLSVYNRKLKSFFRSVLHLLMDNTLCLTFKGLLDLSLVIGLEGWWGWVLRRVSIVLYDNCSRGSCHSFLSQCRINPLSEELLPLRAGGLLPLGVGMPPTLIKKTHQNLRTQCPQLHQGPPTIPRANLQDPILFQSMPSL